MFIRNVIVDLVDMLIHWLLQSYFITATDCHRLSQIRKQNSSIFATSVSIRGVFSI